MGLIVYGNILFDRLVETEYQFFPTAWRNDGRPDGYFWSAPECTFFRSARARGRLASDWLWSTPEWLSQSPEFQPLLKDYRLVRLTTIICFATLAVLVISLR